MRNQSLVKTLQQCSNNKEAYLCMMNAHMKRMYVQYVSSWLNDHALGEHDGVALFQQDDDSSRGLDGSDDLCSAFLRYPVLEAAANIDSVHLRLKVLCCFYTCFMLFHVGSYWVILNHNDSYWFTVMWSSWTWTSEA